MASQRSVIRGGRVLDLASKSADAVDLLVEDGLIRDIAPPGTPFPADARKIDAADRLLVPGLVNAHTHAHGALGRGAVADRVPLEVFLSSSASINGNRTLEDKYLSAALSAAEMIRKGCTACYDLFVELPQPTPEGIDAVAQAYMDSGMRAVVAPMMADRTLYWALPGLIDAFPADMRERYAAIAATPLEKSLDACRTAFRSWRFDRSRVRPAVAPTIPLHCSDDFLVASARLADEFDVRLQSHLAETKAQAILGITRYGGSLTAHLDALGVLSPRFSGAHGIWLDDEDIARLADAGAAIAHNPASNLRIGSGVAPVRRMIDAGLTVGIGTDASNTSDGQNMFEAARLAAYLSRIQTADPDAWISASESLALATVGSAKLLGFDRLGRIAPGYHADIVFLRLDHPHYVPLRDPAIQVAFAETGAAVDRVMIDGRIVLENGQLVTLDEAALRRAAEQAAIRLDEANRGSIPSDVLCQIVGSFCIAHNRLRYATRRRIDD